MALRYLARLFPVLLLLGGAARAQGEDPCAKGRIGELAVNLFAPASPAAQRRDAVKALGECKTPAVVGLLEQKLFYDEAPEVRSAAVSALVANGTPEGVRALRRALGWGAGPELRAEIGRALGPRARTAPAAPAAPAETSGSTAVASAPQPAPRPKAPYRPTPPPSAGVAPPRIATPTEVPPPRIATPTEVLPPEPIVPAVPFAQQDGLAFAVTTSAISGGTLMPFLAALAQQKTPLTLTLTSAAGAIIGGGSAWGLSLFGARPKLPQAVWYANTTAWGTLAGLALHSGLVRGSGLSPDDQDRALWGLLAGGETAGIAAGVWSASAFEWKPGQIIAADSLLIGSYVAYGGIRLLQDQDFQFTPAVAIATVPLMVGSAVASRYFDPSPADLHLVSATALASAWTGFLLASGTSSELNAGMHGVGGVLTGTGAGFLAAIAASPFVEIEPRRSWGTLGFLAAGNLFGLGTHMVLAPLDASGNLNTRAWPMGAALGGLAFSAGAFAAWPYLKFGPNAVDMSFAGAGYGGLTWFIATTAADTGVRRPSDPPVVGGGVLAGAAALGTAGLLASGWFEPTPWDHLVVASGTLAGIGAGLGTARLLAPNLDQRGAPDFFGVLAGSTVGFTTAALVEHYSSLRGTDYGAWFAGAAWGTMAGALLPTIGNEQWIDPMQGDQQGRIVGGGTMLGAAAAGAAAATASHLFAARPGQVAVPTVGAALGTAMGVGLGWLTGDTTTRGPRLGAVIGSAALIGAGIGVDPWLKLSEGLGPSAPQLGTVGTALGLGYGLLLSELPQTPSSTTVGGGALFGATAGLTAGLVSSKLVVLPPGGEWTLALEPAFGGLLGRGIGLVANTAQNPIADRRALALEGIGGATLGVVGAALQNRYAPLEPIDALAAFEGGAFGTFIGLLSPTLASPTWPADPFADRMISGGTMIGASAGALSAALARRATGVGSAKLWVGSLGGLDGIAMGLGAGLLLDPSNGAESQAERIGMVAGASSGIVAFLGADPWLKLSEGLGPSAPQLGMAGTALGLGYGLLLSELPQTPSSTTVSGGALFGASAGLTAGLISSKLVELPPGGEWTLMFEPALGGLLGRGIGLVANTTQIPIADRRALALEAIGGATLGTVGAVLQNRYAPLEPIDALAAFEGGAFGTFIGLLSPTLGSPTWPGDPFADRTISGGTMIGASAGALSAALARRATGVGSGKLWVGSFGGLDGIAMGLGIGLLLDSSNGAESQAERIGMVAGAASGIGAFLGVDPWLELSKGLGPSAPRLGTVGTVVGLGYGLLLSELPQAESGTAVAGGALFGATAGLTAGLVSSKLVELPPGGEWTLTLEPVFGGLLGRGIGLVANTAQTPVAARRLLAVESLGGATAGVVGAVLQNRYAPFEPIDGAAAFEGGAFGTFLGLLAPTLNSPTWPTGPVADRQISGGTMIGLSAGALSAALARRATGAGSRTLWSASLGGLDGIGMGLGFGLLFSPVDGSSSQPERIGMVAGAVAGLGIGTTLWPSLQLDHPQSVLIRTATLVSGWTGLWLPTLGEANFGDAISSRALGKRAVGGLLAGVGVGSFAATLAAPALKLDDDVFEDALTMYVIAGGAGAGMGALLSTRDDAPVGAMLGAGTAGLLAGGWLHHQIDFQRSMPLAVGLGAEGAWLGAWSSLLLSTSPDGQPLLNGVTGRTFIGGTAAGLLTGVGAAALIGDSVGWEQRRTGVGLVGSAALASVAGGITLLAPPIQNRFGVGLLMAASAVGFAGGAWAAPQLESSERATLLTALGAGIGVAEANAFAWASGASTGNDYGGASLVGAGLGATLGLAGSAISGNAASGAPAAAGFAAWGAWIGSFGGALAYENGGPEVHRVTLGGLVGAHAGFLLGLGLLQTHAIESRDIGWISLFGGVGTLVGAGVTAPFSSVSNPAPVLAGLAAGPLLGMVSGVLIWPRIREQMQPHPEPHALRSADPASGSPGNGSGLLPPYLRVKEWQPVFTMLPSPSGGEGTMLIGAQGTLW